MPTKLSLKDGKIYLANNLKVAKACPDTMDCVGCTSSPSFLKVTLGDGAPIGEGIIETDFAVGGTLTDNTGNTCETVPANYILPFRPGTAPPNEDCRWSLSLCHETTSGALVAEVFKFGTEYFLKVSITGGVADPIWEENLGTTKPDCTTFSNQAVTFQSESAGICTGYSNLKCYVTSLTEGPADEDDQCGFCSRGTYPDRFIAKISGSITNGTCTDCTDLEDREVVLNRNFSQFCCTWSGTYVGLDCHYQYDLSIYQDEYCLVIYHTDPKNAPSDIVTSGIIGGWCLTGLTYPHDCRVDRTLSFVSGLSTRCDFTGTTVEVKPDF